MRKALLITNILTGVVLVALLLRENYPKRIYNKLFSVTLKPHVKEKPYCFADNTSYLNYTTLYPLYTSHKNIVMLGNSLTDYANWDELLNRNDVANRGIGGDITAGYINRINSVIALKPKICFIDGGVNDLGHSINQDTIIKNLTHIIGVLQSHRIKSVLTTVILVTEKCTWCANALEQNNKSKELNKKIFQLGKSKGINVIDLNQFVSNENYLNKEYAAADGIHFAGKTYMIWKHEIEKILNKTNL